MELLKDFTKTNKKLLMLSILFITLNTLTMLIIPFFVSHMINDGILQKNMQVVNSISLQMVAILILGTVAGLIGSYLSASFASKFAQSNRKKMVRNIEKITLDQVDQFGIASLVTRVTNDNANAQQVILTFLQMILPSPIMAIISIFLTAQIYPLLALVPLIAITIFVITTWFTLNKSLPYIQNIQRKMDKMTLVLREFFVGVRIIRAFDNSKREKKRTDDSFEDYAKNNIKINQNFAILTPVAFCLMNLAIILIVWFGSMLVAGNTLQIGSITALIEFTTTTIATLIMSALVLFQLPKGIASINRINDIIKVESEIKDQENLLSESDQSKITPIQKLEYQNINFRYKGAEKRILDTINFSVKAGETLAIVGGTGSGKSSIIKILLRLNNIESGEIKINGTSIHELSLASLRNSISYVPQKAFLFSGTIKENFQFANPAITQEEMEAVAETAQALDFIQSLEKKFDAPVSQGGMNFSGGQKQRLSIARALSKEAGIYIFDDSFSALDYATDAKLRKALDSYLYDRIIIIVAQRLSTIASADKIIVLDDGKIVGTGNHETLLRENKHYQDLARSQGLLKEDS
ncbi:TPA: ABC transporter ATP-binding protein [Enterococcus faecalis]|uniref:ABC transporter ATP-binding protein n=1 Tax=Enterococcus faecalis TaxID=1351 RepID=UPI001F200592|nr:ABC transporter ATP-binding protein [Enterococcus faecalis]UJQ88668.1 ABC transporter ATP-binding protein/permease [Enterococcus faecalis]HAP4450106.1 ABC transporter ATP-binding protein [Enterococcus faecalis]HAP4459147.1 ABC transporter ATP-binding protein [Enterococcus faecalis]HAP4462379.1 ABC transporter ATP-binding protein [Enterococcus faecalis]HAP4471606.1 ABC transporter ATP-binding protein [Enterococcus faecalis]